MPTPPTSQHVPVVTTLDVPALEALCLELANNVDGSIAKSREQRRRGVVFTPPALAHYLCREVLHPLIGSGRRLTVLDPAAGDGSLLAAAGAILGAGHRLIGLERDPELATLLARRLPTAEIHICEALLGAPALPPVDAVVANPPYVRSVRLRSADPVLWEALAGVFAATSHGEWDLYAAFVERAPTWLRPGGRFGLLVPSRWLVADNTRELRAQLAASGLLRAIIDFGGEQVFRGATTYASIVIGERREEQRHSVPMARRTGGGWQAGHIAPTLLGKEAWVMPSEGAVCFARWQGRGPTLGEVADIAKGAGSNADRVFVIERALLDGDVVRGWSGGEEIVVEAGITVPLIRGRDVLPWGDSFSDDRGDGSDVRAVFPYAPPYRPRDLIPFAALRAQFPRAAAYLERAHDLLASRERGRFRGDGFHAWGRPQNLSFHLAGAPKVIVPDVVRAPRASLDRGGTLVLDSAYAVRPRRNSPFSVEVLWVLLNAPWLRGWLDYRSVPLRGGYTRIKTAVVSPMPMPAPGDWSAEVTQAVQQREYLEAEELLARAYRGVRRSAADPVCARSLHAGKS